MQRVHICEDQKPILDTLWAIVKNYIMIEDLAMEVCTVCTNPKEFVETIEGDFHLGDLYFLDIDLNHPKNDSEKRFRSEYLFYYNTY